MQWCLALRYIICVKTEEIVRSFETRLQEKNNNKKTVSANYNEMLRLTNDVNYTKEIPRDVLTRGNADSEIQIDLVGGNNRDMTLWEVFQFVEAKEAGKGSAPRLLDSNVAEAARSTYKKNKYNCKREARSMFILWQEGSLLKSPSPCA